MKLKRVKFEDHPRLGNLSLEFANHNGKATNNIILAGENGTGKTAILEAIADIANISLSNGVLKTKIDAVYEIDRNEADLIFRSRPLDDDLGSSYKGDLELHLQIDRSKAHTWSKYSLTILDAEGKKYVADPGIVTQEQFRLNVFKVAFSPVEINFQAGSIQSVTTKDLDVQSQGYLRASANLPNEVAQLLVDIQVLDDAVIGEWARNNSGKVLPDELIDQRVSRFRRAFSTMFPSKTYKGIRNRQHGKEAIFDEAGREITLNDLSSGEKQIVFRGSFLLSNQRSLSGAIIIVDEPEISLHPNWQTKIIDYYKNIFINEKGEQTSQIFFATHSPFIIHNILDEHVVVLRKDSNGNSVQVKDASYPTIGPAKIIEKAFDFKYILPKMERPVILFVEGESDKFILEQAWDKLFEGTPRRFEIVAAYAASQIRTILSRGDIFSRSPHKSFVGLFDFDSAYNDWKGLKNSWSITERDA